MQANREGSPPEGDAPPPPVGEISHWLTLLKAGDPSAAQPLWAAYFARLVGLLHNRMPHPGAVDLEGVAASAFQSFFARASRGQFPRLDDRHDLWALLVTIAGCKMADHLERENALKRGGGKRRVDAEVLDTIISREPTPEFAAMVTEEFESLLARLGDDTLRKITVWKMEGETNPQIAERLGCALRTVANKLELIRKILSTESET